MRITPSCRTINYFCSPVFFSTVTEPPAHSHSSSSSGAPEAGATEVTANKASDSASARASIGATTATSTRTSQAETQSSRSGTRLLSRLREGSKGARVVRGLQGVPVDQRPILFVGNHQTYAPDLSIIVQAMLKHGIVLRGLTHPIALGMVSGREPLILRWVLLLRGSGCTSSASFGFAPAVTTAGALTN